MPPPTSCLADARSALRPSIARACRRLRCGGAVAAPFYSCRCARARKIFQMHALIRLAVAARPLFVHLSAVTGPVIVGRFCCCPDIQQAGAPSARSRDLDLWSRDEAGSPAREVMWIRFRNCTETPRARQVHNTPSRVSFQNYTHTSDISSTRSRHDHAERTRGFWPSPDGYPGAGRRTATSRLRQGLCRPGQQARGSLCRVSPVRYGPGGAHRACRGVAPPHADGRLTFGAGGPSFAGEPDPSKGKDEIPDHSHAYGDDPVATIAEVREEEISHPSKDGKVGGG